MYLKCVVIELWILLYILLLVTKYIYISVKTLKTLKNYAVIFNNRSPSLLGTSPNIKTSLQDL